MEGGGELDGFSEGVRRGKKEGRDGRHGFAGGNGWDGMQIREEKLVIVISDSLLCDLLVAVIPKVT